MDFGHILKKSFDNVKRYRYLWGLGVLGALTSSSGFTGYNFPSNANYPDNLPDELTSQANTFFNQTGIWIANHALVLLTIFAISMVIGIIIIYVSLRAQAGQIIAVKRIEDHKPFKNFTSAFAAGKGFAWELFWLNLLAAAAIIVWLLLTIALPVLLMFLIQVITIYIFAGLLLLLGTIGLIVLAVWVGLGVRFGQREIVLRDKPILESFEIGLKLARKNPGNSIVALLIEFLIGILGGLGLLVVSALIGGIFAVIGLAVYLLSGTLVTVIYAIILGIPLVALLFVLAGIINSYMSSYWTLVYLKMK